MKYCGNTFNQLRIIIRYIFTHSLCLTFIRATNRVLAFISLKLKIPHCLNKPVFLFVESSSVCNLKCPFCPCGSGARKPQQQFLEFAKFKEVVDKTYPYVIGAGLFLYGEPLLNKEIVKMVEYANSRGIITSIHTNMNVMDEELASGLVKAGLFNLVFSCDGCSQESYQKYRVGGEISKVFANIKTLIAARKQLKRRNPIIAWQYLVNKHNQHELSQAQKTSKLLGVDFFVNHFFQIPPDENTIRSWATDIDRFSLYDGHTLKEKQKPQEYCNDLWDTLRVDADGNAYFCCYSADSQAKNYGNIYNQSLNGLWNGPEMALARTAVGGKGSGAEKTRCTGCKYHPQNFSRLVLSKA